jgi:hypothetical protein
MAEPLTLRARMYQTKSGMSTGGMLIAPVLLCQIGLFGADHAVLGGTAPTSVGGTAPTWVTCPIFRPGRGGPLP